jgi:hypothetical protein
LRQAKAWRGQGYWTVKRKTASGRFRRALAAVTGWIRTHRHRPKAEQHIGLARRLRGHNNYYGLQGNSEALYRFLYDVRCAWRKWLDRRSHKSRMTW